MNPVDHPHGGGEGKSKGGRHPVTPWGVPTLSASAPAARTRNRTSSSSAAAAAGGETLSVSLEQEGPVRGGAPAGADRRDERRRQEADDPHLVAGPRRSFPTWSGTRSRCTTDASMCRCSSRSRWSARSRRVCADTPLPRSRRRLEDAGETVTAARDYVGATAKFVHVTPRKARLVADHIRGRSVPEARTILAFTPRAAARDIEKVLKSACRERGVQPEPRLERRRPRHLGRLRRRGPDAEALAAARARPRQPD